MPSAKYNNKFFSELHRGLNFQLFGESEHGSVWSARLKRHYAQPLSEQIKSLLLGDDAKESDTEELTDNVVKLVS